MNKEAKQGLYTRAIDEFGEIAQTIVASQKFAALIACLNAEVIGRNKVTPQKRLDLLADAQIMLDQMKIIYSCCPTCYQQTEYRRIGRLIEILNDPDRKVLFQTASFDSAEERDNFILDFINYTKNRCKKS